MSPILTALISASLQATEPSEQIGEVCPAPWYSLYFAEGSAALTPGGIRMIDSWIGLARRLDAPFNRFTIEANTDRTGSAEANLALSWRRGRAVMRYLVRRGFDLARIRIRAMGESEQWTFPDEPPDRRDAVNRRVSLILETSGANIRRVLGEGVLC